ncbi:MAG: type I-E CRISPR-associated endoribonuclease Cas2 [Chloroflexi bacterium HGW-Chloroflexi-3]|nr:MAG: type I-E CRISPR-associated endoribonuclease Cas2 [Chloroflexi bacterium HGW-Chloroflexi-3]
MVVMILEKVPTSLRGELSRWLIEPRTGMFVGHVSARVRDKLWEKCSNNKSMGGIIQIWTTNTEQHFQMRMIGNTSRWIVEEEGLQLVKVPGENKKAKRLERNGRITIENNRNQK